MVEITTLQCTVCGEGYTYDDGASPQWASVFCGTPCKDAGMVKTEEDEEFEDFDPEEDADN